MNYLIMINDGMSNQSRHYILNNAGILHNYLKKFKLGFLYYMYVTKINFKSTKALNIKKKVNMSIIWG